MENGNSSSLALEKVISFGRKCNAIYEQMVRRLGCRKDVEARLRWVRVIAGFAWMFHSGRYADGRIENPALEVGTRISDAPFESEHLTVPQLQLQAASARRRVLHVATTVYDIGGHSRLIKNWIHHDKSSEHSLLLIDQQVKVPPWMTASVEESGGNLIVLPVSGSLLDKARALRGIAQQNFDAVVLHHHPDDVVPIVAFAAENCPPVALMNHADHVFGLGTSVADVVLNVRGFAARISETRRFAKKNLLLPVPLEIPTLSITKAEARRRLGIPKEKTVILTIGTAYKFTPTQQHDFFATAHKILTENAAAHLFVIGISAEESHKYLNQAKHERFHFLGIVEDPAFYKLAADLYLDPMPWGSLTALLEVVALGIPPVLMYAPPAPQFDSSEDVGFSGLLACSPNEDAYIEQVNSLIKHPELRQEIGTRLRETTIAHHAGEKWREYLAAAYDFLEGSPHRPAYIPDGQFMQTADDLEMFSFNFARHSNTPLVRQAVERDFEIFTLSDIVRLFFLSLTLREKLSYEGARIWLQMFGSKVKSQILRKNGLRSSTPEPKITALSKNDSCA